MVPLFDHNDKASNGLILSPENLETGQSLEKQLTYLEVTGE